MGTFRSPACGCVNYDADVGSANVSMLLSDVNGVRTDGRSTPQSPPAVTGEDKDRLGRLGGGCHMQHRLAMHILYAGIKSYLKINLFTDIIKFSILRRKQRKGSTALGVALPAPHPHTPVLGEARPRLSRGERSRKPDGATFCLWDSREADSQPAGPRTFVPDARATTSRPGSGRRGHLGGWHVTRVQHRGLVTHSCSRSPRGLGRGPTLLHVFPARSLAAREPFCHRAETDTACPATGPLEEGPCVEPRRHGQAPGLCCCPTWALSTRRLCGRSANKSTVDGMGFPEPRPPRTRTGRPGGPAPPLSGVCKSLWPPGRRG